MRISEIAGLSVASGVGKHLEKMLLKPTKINFDSGHGTTHQIRSDTFLANVIAFRSEASEISPGDRNVHPVTILGFYTTEEALNAIFKDQVVLSKFKTFDVTKPKGPENPHGSDNPRLGGYYDRPGKNFFGKAADPGTGGIYLNKLLMDRGREIERDNIYSHEVMHRGLAMANWNKEIKKYINPIMLKPPFDAWGSTDSKDEQFRKSNQKFGNQLGALEHIMMYAWEGGFDRRYEQQPYYFRTVPGFEDYISWKGVSDKSKAKSMLDKGKKPQSVKAVASGLLNLIGKGCTSYIINLVQKINNVPDEDLDLLMYKFAQMRGIV